MSKFREQLEVELGTSIWVPKRTKDELDKRKVHPREPYYQVIDRLMDGCEHGKEQ